MEEYPASVLPALLLGPEGGGERGVKGGGMRSGLRALSGGETGLMVVLSVQASTLVVDEGDGGLGGEVVDMDEGVWCILAGEEGREGGRGVDKIAWETGEGEGPSVSLGSRSGSMAAFTFAVVFGLR